MSDAAPFNALIVGGGHGGAQAATVLRQAGFAGTIAIVTEEPEYPYERPPLSKEYFSGEKSAERIRIRPPSFWEERGIQLIRNERITSIDPSAHVATASSGKQFGYRKLIWAAGGTPRRLSLPEASANNVLAIRTLADADRLKALCVDATNIVVIGAGYIGLEAAAVLAKAGKHVTVLEALDRVLARATGHELARYVEEVHRSHDIDLRLGAAVGGLEGSGTVSAVRLADGSYIPCDLVVVGIGIVPEVEPLRDAGAKCSNGVEVDEFCRTSLPDIFAIGDCAAHRNSYAQGAMIRLESVQNASDMAKTVAAFVMGEREQYSSVPWFWSNQFDLKIQTIGLSMGHDATVVRGSMASGAFSIVYLREGSVIALDCVNSARDYVQGKALVVARAKVPVAELADASRPLKELLVVSSPV